jgi:hypothetical protein
MVFYRTEPGWEFRFVALHNRSNLANGWNGDTFVQFGRVTVAMAFLRPFDGLNRMVTSSTKSDAPATGTSDSNSHS